MTPKDVFDVIADVRDVFVSTGVFDAAGNFTDLKGSEIARAAAGIEERLKQRGVDVPANLDKIIQAAPMILALTGVS
jgi:hypothetical protein